MRKLTPGIITVMLLLIALVVVITGVPMVFDRDAAEAGLDKGKMVGLTGPNYSDALGNTTGAYRSVKLSNAEFFDESNCFFTVTNSSGVTIANTSTAVIETSVNDIDYETFATISVASNVITGARNTPGAATPSGNYVRLNITAIQNSAGTTYVRARCLFK